MIECPTCGEKYERIGQHWAFNEAHRPNFSKRQVQIIDGLVLGDGCITTERGGDNSVFIIEMIEEDFISWLDDELGCLSRGYTMSKSARESANQNTSEKFSSDPDKYSDLYRLVSRPHPYFTEAEKKFYDSRKVYPENLEMTPIKLKMWYVYDGHLSKNREGGREDVAKITNTVQIHDLNFSEIFTELHFNPTISEGSDNVYIPSSQIDKFFEYIGNPVPGFDYKWPESHK